MVDHYCQFCGEPGNFAGCACDFRDILGCRGKSCCMNCERSHQRVLGPFFAELLETKPAQRSNSPRIRLFQALYELVGSYEELRSRALCFEFLRGTGAFDENLLNFRGRILRAIELLPLNNDCGARLKQLVGIVKVERAMENLTTVIADKLQQERHIQAIKDFVCCAAKEIANGRL